MTYPPQPEPTSKRATVTAALVIVAAIVILIVMLTLQLAGAASFAWSVWLVVVLAPFAAVMLVAVIASNKRLRRARHKANHPATTSTTLFSSIDEADRIKDQIKKENQ